MSSYEHKRLVDRIKEADRLPVDAEAFARWIKAKQHIDILLQNAIEDELIIYASGDYTYVSSVAVPNKKLVSIDKKEMARWSFNPFGSVVSYVTGGGRRGVRIEDEARISGSTPIAGLKHLVFGKTFEGWSGEGRDYFEAEQGYAHLARIHWRPELGAYCRYDELGDIERVVSITTSRDDAGVSLVSFKRRPLEEYLAALNATLVRVFDFTLLKREDFVAWPSGPEQQGSHGEHLVWRGKEIVGNCAYTHGAQIVPLSKSRSKIQAEMVASWSGREKREYAAYIAYDWRHKRVRKISTDPRKTTNYFDKTDGLPFELSPAFFRPDVLLKYKSDREKYAVGERDISCRAAWHLRGFDVNPAGQIHAYICDLRHLPYPEQLHWLSFNERPRAPISRRAIENDFAGQFSSEIAPLEQLREKLVQWHEAKVAWWILAHKALLHRPSVPRSASTDEWAEAFLDLSKLVVEGFVTKAIRAQLESASVKFDKDDKTIVLLEKLYNGIRRPVSPARFEGLRAIQKIRSKVKGHTEGSEAKALMLEALAQHETFAAHFEQVCTVAIAELQQIEKLFGLKSS